MLICFIYIAWASDHYQITLCDQQINGFGGDGGDFQVMMYDKPWYHGPAYFVGTLLAIVYVTVRDPETKAGALV